MVKGIDINLLIVLFIPVTPSAIRLDRIKDAMINIGTEAFPVASMNFPTVKLPMTVATIPNHPSHIPNPHNMYPLTP